MIKLSPKAETPQKPLPSRVLPGSVQGLLLLLLAVALVPVLLFQGGMYYSRYQELRNQEYQANLELARSVGATFEVYLLDVLRTAAVLGDALTLSPAPSQEEANRLLASGAGEYPSVRHFAWLDPQGVAIASGAANAIGASAAERPYFHQILQGSDFAVSDLLVGAVTGEPTFTIARAVRDGEGRLLGVVVASVDPTGLGNLFAIHRAQEGAISIIDRNGYGVYRYPEVQWTWESRNWLPTQPIIGEALAGREAMGTFVSVIDGRERMTGIVPVRSIGWAASANRPTDVVTGPILRRVLGELLLLAIAAGLAFLTALLVGRGLTLPLQRLRDQALALGEGRLEAAAQPGGPAEVKDL
jgi:hypothetical protein